MLRLAFSRCRRKGEKEGGGGESNQRMEGTSKTAGFWHIRSTDGGGKEEKKKGKKEGKSQGHTGE